MNKTTISTLLIITIGFTGCTSNSEVTTDGLESKVQDRMQEKATDKMLGQVGLPGLKKEKTMEEKITDVATGKMSMEDTVMDAAVDEAADMSLRKVGI